MPIICTERELATRTNKIRNLLNSIGNGRIAAARIPTGDKHSVILSAYSGSLLKLTHTDMRFKTTSDGHKGCYYEVWVLNQSNWALKCAYLQILENDKEILSLHCDPLEPKTSKSYKYKCGPHIHIKHPSDEKISNAHISLNLSNFENVVSSLENFDSTFAMAIKMVQEEFLAA